MPGSKVYNVIMNISSNFLARLPVVGKTPTPLAVEIAAGQQWHIHALPPPSTLGSSLHLLWHLFKQVGSKTSTGSDPGDPQEPAILLCTP